MVAKATGKGRAGAVEDLAQDWCLECLSKGQGAWWRAWAWWRGWEVPVNLKKGQSPDSRADVP